jgi:hypothetical protein
MWRVRRVRDLTYAANRLAPELEAAASRSGAPSGPTSSMFPYALLDILTHFGMTADEYRAGHDRNYPDRNPTAYDEYWGHRDALGEAVRSHIEADPVEMNAAIEAALEFLSRVDGTADTRSSGETEDRETEAETRSTTGSGDSDTSQGRDSDISMTEPSDGGRVARSGAATSGAPEP